MKKKITTYTLTTFILIIIFFVFACEDHQNVIGSNLDKVPVLNQDFSFEKNDNTVKFTTNLSGQVWFTNTVNGDTYYISKGEVSVDFCHKGEYYFSCSYSVDNEIFISDTFSFVIANDNLLLCPSEYDEDKPVLNEDFSYFVYGDYIVFNTILSGNIWITHINTQTDYVFYDNMVTLTLLPGVDNKFVCSILLEGVTHTSDTITISIIIENWCTDLLQVNLTGGLGQTKTWVLDTLGLYFHNPIDFYGDEEAGGASDNVWGPWGGCKITDWMPDGYTNVSEGSISFNCGEGSVQVNLNGKVYNGYFMLDSYSRDPNFLIFTDGITSLWDNMLQGVYSYLGDLSTEMGDLYMDGTNVRLPIDKFRFDDDQYIEDDLKDVTIMHCSDSALIVRVKRTFEGGNYSTCWLLYNYIVEEYDYGKIPVAPEQPVKTTFTQSDLIGTWGYDAVAQDWIWWLDARKLNTWNTRQEMIDILVSWGGTDAADVFSAADKQSFVFNSDGTCILNGILNTYSVSNGVITFGTALTGSEFSLMWISLTGSEIYALDVQKDYEGNSYTYDGIWIGQQYDDKEESKAVHLIKK